MMGRAIAPADRGMGGAQRMPRTRVPGAHTYICAGAIVRQA
jgi:hypothetical protein